ncbi:MAG: PIN domain-containing protein [Nanoarchaeota archaeon]
MSGKTSTRIGTIGIDTAFLIDFFNGEKSAILFMGKHAKLLRVSELVIYEFLCGNLTGREQEVFMQAIQSFPAVPFQREAAIRGSRIFRTSKKEGKSIGHQDCMIAGSYLANGIERIVTRNAGHFSKMREIELMRY